MYKVTKELNFCYGHRLMEYEGKCRFLHGHNGRVEIELQSKELDSIGMVRDFTEVKQVIQTWLDETMDHRMLLRSDDPIIPTLTQLGEPLFIFKNNPTAESIARVIYDFALSKGFPVSEVRMWESEGSFATYRGEGSSSR